MKCAFTGEPGQAGLSEHPRAALVGLGGGSRLYTWQGRDPSLRPVLFISHFDVVPVTPGTEQDWVHPPFSGAIADGHVWGRGALDVKFSVAALLEAASELLRKGYQPQRTIMMSFGNDEEIGGTGGAQLIAQHLAEKGVELELIIDEGGLIISDGLKGAVDQPLALVATAEKVYTSVELELASKGGHSSMPPIDKSDIASQAARMVQAVNTEPMPGEIRPPISGFLEAISHYLNPSLDYPFVRGLMRSADKWPLNKIFAQFFLHSSSELAALVRTTVAVTRVSAGVADNVLPNIGQMIFNMRAHPETPRKDVLAYLEGRMKDANLQPGAKLRVTNASHLGPVPGVSPADGPGFKLLKQAIQEHWRHQGQGIAVSPYLLTGGTDSKHFSQLTRAIYRFVPYSVNKTAGDLRTIHSTNERVRAADFTLAVCTYARVMELLSAA
ncbi:hypothetical protein DUNSADRAFT_6216 [Dunaliella salina]|uniref:Peptidase M20 dimerisation domain-containing protein n=1 Tax=Dunaliella salina TaxID=3046 RepID=A0ABQ7GNR7_DUNSA|nr:hypothetical protein DUNSADRAFT_6216 [Dunaliella salina]|eukprot:KAF5836264.1 hypothetical protein DUNSADRAFT_6216 [Dunaliella salina]